MNNLILIVEDKLDQVRLAQDAVTKSGHIPVVARNLTDGQRLLKEFAPHLLGVVTDMHFQSMADNRQDADKPNGLCIVAKCVRMNIPVSVCTDVNHHFCKYVETPISVLASHQNYKYRGIPVSFDRKDWHESLQRLLELLPLYEKKSELVLSNKVLFVTGPGKFPEYKLDGYEIFFTSHTEAFVAISEHKPSVILCLAEYMPVSHTNSKFSAGAQRYYDIRRSLLLGQQKLIRMAFMNRPEDDLNHFLRLPFGLEDLAKALPFERYVPSETDKEHDALLKEILNKKENEAA